MTLSFDLCDMLDAYSSHPGFSVATFMAARFESSFCSMYPVHSFPGGFVGASFIAASFELCAMLHT